MLNCFVNSMECTCSLDLTFSFGTFHKRVDIVHNLLLEIEMTFSTLFCVLWK